MPRPGDVSSFARFLVAGWEPSGLAAHQGYDMLGMVFTQTNALGPGALTKCFVSIPSGGPLISREILDLNGWWHIWYDEAAPWQSEMPLLPGVPLREVPSRPPTSGWQGMERGLESLQVPGTWALSRPRYRGVAWQWRPIYIPEEWQGRVVRLQFGGVRLRAEVYLDEELVGYDLESSTPFEVDVTDKVRPGRQHELALRITNPGGSTSWPDELPIPWAGLFSRQPRRGRYLGQCVARGHRPGLYRLGACLARSEPGVGHAARRPGPPRPSRRLPRVRFPYRHGSMTRRANGGRRNWPCMASHRRWQSDRRPPRSPALDPRPSVLLPGGSARLRRRIRGYNAGHVWIARAGSAWASSLSEQRAFFPTRRALSGLVSPQLGLPQCAARRTRSARGAHPRLECSRDGWLSRTPHLLDAADRLGLLIVQDPAGMPGPQAIPTSRCPGVLPRAIPPSARLARRDRNHPSLVWWRLAGPPDLSSLATVRHAVPIPDLAALIHTEDPTRLVGRVLDGPPVAWNPYSPLSFPSTISAKKRPRRLCGATIWKPRYYPSPAPARRPHDRQPAHLFRRACRPFPLSCAATVTGCSPARTPKRLATRCAL